MALAYTADCLYPKGGDGMAPLIFGGLILVVLLLLSVTRPAITAKDKVEHGERLGKLIYTDEGGGKLLVAEAYDLQGKPDYIFQSMLTGHYIPFEIKSGKCKDAAPHPGDLMQLAAYFVLIEAVYGKKPPYGKLVYSNKTFKVRNTRGLRRQLLRTLKQMRSMLEGHTSVKAEPSYIKCKNCVCQQTVCEWYDEA